MTDSRRLSRTDGLTVLEVVQRYAPRLYKTNQNPRNRYSMRCPLPGHEGDREHPDHSGSFSVDQTERLFKCFGCDGRGNSYQLRQILGGSDQTVVTPKPKTPASQSPHVKVKRRRSRPTGVTIAQLAKARGRDPDFLRDSLGWRDTHWWNIPAIEIPYPDEHNGSPLIRYRVGLNDDDRFRWKKFAKGQGVRLYGLWTLDWIQPTGHVIIVEGETDFAALSAFGYPVLAVPGAGNWRSEWAHHIRGLDIYVWQEPGAAGELLASKLARDFPELRVITAPADAKDPCDLAAQAGASFPAEMDQLITQARRWWQPAVEPEADNWAQGTPQEELLIVPSWQNDVLADVRDRARQGYLAARMGKAASDMETCYRQLRLRIWDSGDQEGIRNHCYCRLCPNCVYLKMGQFIEEKQEAFDNLTDPAIYRVKLGARYVGLSPAEMWDRFQALYTDARKLLKGYKISLKRDSRVAGNHVYLLRVAVRAGWAALELVLLANHEDRAVSDLKTYFSGKVGYDVTVETLRWEHLTDQEKRLRRALECFKRMVATEFSWDTTDEFQAWYQAVKGKKLVQGVGVFQKASGGMGSQGNPADEYHYGGGINPFNGEFESFYQLDRLIPEEHWERFYSDYTGRYHLRPKAGFDPLVYEPETERWDRAGPLAADD
ncbi:MAG: hypothetical protein O2913_11995 [Chloroflexi bacterium]|nr:hypothetical protein [Chloroflexota bacterium]